jgi:MFS family permease
MLSRVGFEMQGVAVGWELFERTHSTFALGLVGLVQVVPVVLLSLPAGQVVDRYSRKGILVLSQLVLVFVSLCLALNSIFHGPVWVMYACLALAGTAAAFGNPARWAILPQIVPLRHFADAVSWRTGAWQISSVAGPALGGVALALGYRSFMPELVRGAAPAYLADSTLGVIVAVVLSGITPAPRADKAEPMTRQSLFAGLKYVFEHDLILAAITLDLFAVLLGGATALLPKFADDILHVGSVGFGFLRAAPAIGAVGMAFWLAHRPPLRKSGRSLLLAVAGFGAATVVFGVSRNVVLSFVMLMVAGGLDHISMVVRGTLVQVLTPDAMRGRVSAVNSVFIGMSNELGAFESGLTASWWGPEAAVVVGGAGCILVVLTVAWRWPRVARLGPLSEIHVHAQEHRPHAPAAEKFA